MLRLSGYNKEMRYIVTKLNKNVVEGGKVLKSRPFGTWNYFDMDNSKGTTPAKTDARVVSDIPFVKMKDLGLRKYISS
jgi:hypothetical protein